MVFLDKRLQLTRYGMMTNTYMCVIDRQIVPTLEQYLSDSFDCSKTYFFVY